MFTRVNIYIKRLDVKKILEVYMDKLNKKYIELLSKDFYPLDKFYDELKDIANDLFYYRV